MPARLCFSRFSGTGLPLSIVVYSLPCTPSDKNRRWPSCLQACVAHPCNIILGFDSVLTLSALLTALKTLSFDVSVCF
ncbi:hypothetical protein CPB86DRAFT_792392 [Serendipita vermifera]|nr:hypothetical protein CPB86DRAFT_792392 [Serendipita vermifera]